MRRVMRGVAAVVLCAPLSAAAAGTGAAGAPFACADAAAAHHVALVVEHGGGAVLTACVGFSSDVITGEQVLAMSGIEYATVDYPGIGKAVCQIDGEPATYPSTCWTASSPYWALYASRGGGGWASSTLGVSSQTFQDGDAEGFRYEAQGDSSPPPAPAGGCPPAGSAPTPPPATHPPSRPTPAPGQPAAAPTPPRSPSATSTAAAAVTVAPTETGGALGAAPAAVRHSASPPSAGADLRVWLLVAGAALLLLGGLGLRLAHARRRPA